jgi:hypothetical protein
MIGTSNLNVMSTVSNLDFFKGHIRITGKIEDSVLKPTMKERQPPSLVRQWNPTTYQLTDYLCTFGQFLLLI